MITYPDMTTKVPWAEQLWPGDVLLLRRTEPLSQLIRYIDDIDDPDDSGGRHPRACDTSHAAMFLGSQGGKPAALSVWPMPDRTGEGDVVVVGLDSLLSVYAGVVVFRHVAATGVGRSAWEADHWPTVLQALEEARSGAARGVKAYRFNDLRMIAAGLDVAWKELGDDLLGRRGRLGRAVADAAVRWLIRRARTEQGLVCPDLFVDAYGRLPEPFHLLPPLGGRRADDLADPDGKAASPLFGAAMRAAIVFVSSVVLTRLVDDDPRVRSLDPTLDAHRTAPMGSFRLVTPGQLARSPRLTPQFAAEPYVGVVAEGDDVWELERGRARVVEELKWGPGVGPLRPGSAERQ